MIKKKICLIGSFGVGKTSLIRKYVQNIFSDQYITTIGVKVEKKTIVLKNEEVLLIIWDLEGTDDFNALAETYLIGMSGYCLVADGTRLETLDVAKELKDNLELKFPNLPAVLLLNKYDLTHEWVITEDDTANFKQENIKVIYTSAKDGTGVEEGFEEIAYRMTKDFNE